MTTMISFIRVNRVIRVNGVIRVNAVIRVNRGWIGLLGLLELIGSIG